MADIQPLIKIKSRKPISYQKVNYYLKQFLESQQNDKYNLNTTNKDLQLSFNDDIINKLNILIDHLNKNNSDVESSVVVNNEMNENDIYTDNKDQSNKKSKHKKKRDHLNFDDISYDNIDNSSVKKSKKEKKFKDMIHSAAITEEVDHIISTTEDNLKLKNMKKQLKLLKK